MFWMIRTAARGASGSKQNRVPRTPKPAGLIGTAGIIACIAVMVYGNATHTWTLAWFVVIPLVCSGLIAAGWMQRGAERTKAIDNVLRQLPSAPRPPATGAELRERARQLSLAPRLDTPPGSLSVPLQPAVRPARSYNQMVRDAELTERMKRVAAILMATCPVCEAGEADLCRFTPDEPVSMLDREQSIVVHDARIGFAIKTGAAKVTDVVAQFGNQVPGSVWEAAL